MLGLADINPPKHKNQGTHTKSDLRRRSLLSAFSVFVRIPWLFLFCWLLRPRMRREITEWVAGVSTLPLIRPVRLSTTIVVLLLLFGSDFISVLNRSSIHVRSANLLATTDPPLHLVVVVILRFRTVLVSSSLTCSAVGFRFTTTALTQVRWNHQNLRHGLDYSLPRVIPAECSRSCLICFPSSVSRKP